MLYFQQTSIYLFTVSFEEARDKVQVALLTDHVNTCTEDEGDITTRRSKRSEMFVYP